MEKFLRKKIIKKYVLMYFEYICEECGCVTDRDYNASVNLMKYGQSIA